MQEKFAQKFKKGKKLTKNMLEKLTQKLNKGEKLTRNMLVN